MLGLLCKNIATGNDAFLFLSPIFWLFGNSFRYNKQIGKNNFLWKKYFLIKKKIVKTSEDKNMELSSSESSDSNDLPWIQFFCKIR